MAPADDTSREFEPYRSRAIRFHGRANRAGTALKLYSVVAGDGPPDLDRFEPGMNLAEEVLPSPATDDRRPGAGFTIAHHGASTDYLVVCWWDNENELPTRVFVRGSEGWRAATERESFCVWDLEILWQERELYVLTVLGGPEAGGLPAYLGAPVAAAEAGPGASRPAAASP